MVRVPSILTFPEAMAREKTKYFEELVRNRFARVGKASATGEFSMRNASSDLIEGERVFLIGVAGFLVLTILLLFFRNPLDAFLGIFVVGWSVALLLGLVGHLGIEFSPMHVAVGPILFGLCIDYFIHMTRRYNEERSKGLEPGEALDTAVVNTGMAVAISAITTAIGFSAWLSVDIPLLRDFGLLCMMGILIMLFSAVILLPAIWAAREKAVGIRKRKPPAYDRAWLALGLNRWLAWSASGAQRHARLVALAVGATTLLALFFMFQTPTSVEYEKLQPSELEPFQTYKEVSAHFPALDISRAIMVVVKGDLTDPDVLRAMLELESNVYNADPEKRWISMGFSIADQIEAKRRYLPTTSEEVREVLEELRAEDPEKVNMLIAPDNRLAYVGFVSHPKTDAESRHVTKLVRDKVNQLPKVEAEFVPAGYPVVTSDAFERIPGSALKSTFFATTLVLVFVCIVFRSPLLGFICMVPICLSLVWEFGAFYTLGLPLNLVTMLIPATVVGIGIDYSVHFACRHREELKKAPREIERSISTSVFRVGGAIFGAMSTTIAAFLVLVLSKMPGVRLIGTLMALVFLFCWIAVVYVSPPLLSALTKRRMRLGKETS